jgi:hypothetical protein
MLPQLNSTPLLPPPPTTRLHIRRLNISTLRRPQLTSKDISHPNQHPIRPPEPLHNLILPTATRSISTIIRVLFENRPISSWIRAFELREIFSRAAGDAPRAEGRVKIALAEVEGVLRRPAVTMYWSGGQALGSSHCWPVWRFVAGMVPALRRSWSATGAKARCTA